MYSKEIARAATLQARLEARGTSDFVISAFTALTLITGVVLSILTMTETVNLTAGSGVLLAGGGILLLSSGRLAYLAGKHGSVPWQKVAAYATSLFLMWAPAVVCGGLTLGGVVDSSLLMGGAFLAPMILAFIIKLIIEKCQSSSSESPSQPPPSE